ncbi:hypothetical protein I7I50_00188 [Histoplasma capsulatum G186AR]|uniref:Uncharacterized protein n=1 Tax=Ajellomyces capsulatus TaxID=5037 RepID=A0A8H7YDJ8_AJECA|nr:hypothetical protein I7I52_07457 [Histoplasma capsulatum]QSS72367.1 hypothetical protein I7I50_00188 [Histoplasma capsulatum G186AR]
MAQRNQLRTSYSAPENGLIQESKWSLALEFQLESQVASCELSHSILLFAMKQTKDIHRVFHIPPAAALQSGLPPPLPPGFRIFANSAPARLWQPVRVSRR